MTASGTGLHYSAAALASSRSASRQPEVDLSLNLHALILLRNLRLGGVDLPSEVTRLEGWWRVAVERGLIRQVEEAQRDGREWKDPETVTLVLLALGSAWVPDCSEKVAVPLSLAVTLAAVDDLSTHAKASLSLALLLPPAPSGDHPNWKTTTEGRDTATPILSYILSSLRVTGRTAYVSSSPHSAASAGFTTNAMALSAFALSRRAGAPSWLLTNTDKLAAFVAELGGGSHDPTCVSLASMYSGFALRDYDYATDSTSADITLSLLAGATLLFSSRILTGSPPEPPHSTPWSTLPSSPPPLLFALVGVGEASVALSLDFVPATISLQPVYRGISVQKVRSLLRTATLLAQLQC